jgi:endo-1,4-beta-xylanase
MKTPIKKKSRPTKAKPRVAPIALLSAIFFVLISLMVYKFLGMKDTIDTPTPVVTAAGPSPTPTIMLTGKVELLNNKWEYMPGTEYSQSAGLVIHPYRFSFVSQDSLEFTSNPPINLAGVYLDNVVGDFTLVSKIDLLQSKTAHIRFYGKLPIIADEFRVERESIQLAIEKGKMTVDTWTGSTQLPFASQIFTYSPNTSFELSTQRKGSKLIFAVNGVEIGQVEELGVFNSGQVWFGLDAVGGDWTLASFVLDESKSGKLNIVDSTSLTITDHNPQGLQALATKKRPGFFIGTAVALGPLVSDPDYSKLALDNNTFGSLTPENEMKMANIQPQRGVFDFKKADAIVKIAKQNGIDYIHGHALVFGEATPEWFSTLPVGKPEDREQIQQIMLNHIETVVKHYGDQVQSWDVVNEPLADYDRFNLETGEVWRNHKWYQAMGVEYLIKALTAAHNANPTA